METWIKAKADQLAQAAQQQVSAVQQSATRLAGDVLDSVRGEGLKELEFRDGPLGFSLEGRLVVEVSAGSQAARLGVAIGDRLVRVDGYEVPPCESVDGFEEQRNRALISKWLKDMPRPGLLTFEVAEVLSEEEPSPGEEANKSSAVQALQAELQRVQEERKKLSAQLQEAQEQRAALGAEAEALRGAKARQQRKLVELEEQLEALRAQNKELLQSNEEAPLEAVARACAAEEEVRALTLKLKEVEGLLNVSRLQVEPLEEELRGFGLAHEAELELLKEEQQRQLAMHQAHIKELEEKLAEQRRDSSASLAEAQAALERLREALQESQANAEAAAMEARAVRMEAASRGEGATEAPSAEVLGMQRRIDLLESRCASLQKRSESVVGERPRAAWELRLAAATGPHVAAVVVTAHRLLLGALRGFLERLLRSEPWLYLFYAHLLVMYALAASCSVQTSDDAGRGAVEALNAQLASRGASGRDVHS